MPDYLARWVGQPLQPSDCQLAKALAQPASRRQQPPAFVEDALRRHLGGHGPQA